MDTSAIAQHLSVAESAIIRVEEWANVIFAVVRGLGARFVSKKVVKMKTVQALVDLSDGFKFDPELIEVNDGYRVCCKECGNWVKSSTPTAQIRHSRSCVSEPQIVAPERAKPVKAINLKKIAQLHRDGYNVGDDAIYDAYQSGYLSMSDAMNSDF